MYRHVLRYSLVIFLYLPYLSKTAFEITAPVKQGDEPPHVLPLKGNALQIPTELVVLSKQ